MISSQCLLSLFIHCFNKKKLGRRNLTNMTEPKFMIRLDLNTAPTSSSSSSSSSVSPFQTVFDHQQQHTSNNNNNNNNNKQSSSIDNLTTPYSSYNESEAIKSLHLQADYANMKHLQTELQRALDELNGVHVQRLTRYIS